MKYAADVLTFFRFPAFVLVFVLSLNTDWAWATAIFAAAIVSDALDGIFARQWPPDDRWYRKNPHDFDNLGDSLLFFSGLAGLVFKGPEPWEIVLWVSAAGSLVILFFIKKLRPSRAEKLDVAFGWCFGILLFAMLVQMTALATPSWIAWSVAYCFVAVLIIVTKWDRMTSRPEVEYKGTW